MNDETKENDEQEAQPDALDEAFPPMSLMDFGPYGEEVEDEEDDFEHHHHEFVLLESEDIDQARRTARAILAAMETLAGQMVQGHGKDEKRGGPQAKDAGRNMEQLASALESVAELIEIYAGIVEHD